LAEILVEQGALDSAHRSLLENLAELVLSRNDGDPEKSIAAFGKTGSTLGEVRDPLSDFDWKLTGDPTVVQCEPVSEALDPLEGDGESATVRTVGAATSNGQRFRVLRLHAKGGLGAVFVALDQELHREVALKQILERHADDPGNRARFLLEAEITGGLEHPGIVPVYGLGHQNDGRPYYAMRLIRGDSLKEAIVHFH